MARIGIVLLALAAACGAQKPWQPSDALDRSARMLRQLDKLEADLHDSDAQTMTYAVLVDRHGKAEQMACKVTDEHVAEIHRLAEAQLRKQQERQARKKKVVVARARPHSGRTLASR
jgi:hypothetical protein